MKLAHLPLPGLTSYQHASNLQSRLAARLLASKTSALPPAVVLTAEFHPVYTTGRRESPTPAQIAHLRASGQAEHAAAPRGGQTTFHGPGQLVAYPVLDIKRHAALSARAYMCLLETTLIDTCARYGVKGHRTENPGVWTDDEHKIAAVGVHLRRNVSTHGVGLNVATDLRWFERIVACGLEGKHATSLEREGVTGVGVEEVGSAFVEELSRGLGMEGVYRIGEDDVPP